MNKSTKVYICLLFCITLWSLAFVVIRIELKSFTASGLASIRYFFASIAALLFYMAAQRNKRLPSKKALVYFFFIGLFDVSLFTLLLNMGEKTVEAGMTGFITSQTPIFVAILSFIFLKERLTRLNILGLSISTLGITIISFSEIHWGHVGYGVLFLLLATLSGATWTILQKVILKDYSPLEMVTWMVWFGALLLMVHAPEGYREWQAASTQARYWAIFLGVFPSVISYLCWSYAISNMKTTLVASSLYLIPFISTIIGWLVLGEVPRSVSIAGGIIAILGVVLVQIQPTQQPPQQHNTKV